ncbi:hydantoinase/oxoprolinase family protein [Methylobacterium currus]|uniref:hydantoinase/oxoprolinase family protein n=1 Tax=Methylobacterium currus TaxID=2051553 RepID=UPI001E3A7EC2|nr:hydantoinase/oxoprolinase family protein [Methylobacterium currus]UHC19503.1 hydantoinase/oxoprolinase family protein [Methylobacterium currus]
MLQFAVDTGGTFTDLIVREADGRARMFKAPTTPADPIAGVLDVLGVAAGEYGLTRADFLGRGVRLVHATTHALNAVVTGTTARTALIVTAGHPDILTLREGGRDQPFNFAIPYPEPYIPRNLTFEMPGRILADGSILTDLDEAAARAVIAEVARAEVEAVAVCLLWSIANPVHERRVGALLAECLPGLPVTLSHAINPAIREFRRASSAAVDASLKPMMAVYMRHLESRLKEAGFHGRTLVVTSQGGVIDAADAAAAPIHILNSGPSMAPVAGRYFAALDEGVDDVIVADTGGTTYDVSLVQRGEIPATRNTWIGPPYRGVMIGFPWVDVKSVGAGGGSIAWIDEGGLLRVGPRSAGAVPGPVAYGRGGTEPTVTDASLALGHLDPGTFLGGAMRLDRDAARAALAQRIAAPLGCSVEEAADAVLTVATENMVQAILDITVNQGVDPRNAVLIGGGGAAGLNSVRIARRLGCRSLLVPQVGPVLSAAGAVMSDLRADFRAAFFTRSTAFDAAGADAVLAELTDKAKAFIAGPGAGSIEAQIRYAVEARYATQVWEIEVPLRDSLLAGPEALAAFVADFHARHRALFSFEDPTSAIEIIGWSAEARCRLNRDNHIRIGAAGAEPGQGTGQGEGPATRRAYFGGAGWVETPVHAFDRLEPDREIPGPAIVESRLTTIVVEPGAIFQGRPSGSLSVRFGEQP